MSRRSSPTYQLVEGDLVCFQAGDQIYADGVLLEGEVDESQLTGEADEVKERKAHVRSAL